MQRGLQSASLVTRSRGRSCVAALSPGSGTLRAKRSRLNGSTDVAFVVELMDDDGILAAANTRCECMQLAKHRSATPDAIG
jgi:hypothetical protein